MQQTKHCPGCGTVKDVEEFNFKNKAKGTRQVRCRLCTRAQVKSHYDRNVGYYIAKGVRRNKEIARQHQEKLLAYLSTHPWLTVGRAG